VALRPWPLVAAFGALLVSGLVHGLWTQRWQTAEALDRAVTRLYAVPMKAGDWKGTTIEVDPELYQQARAVGYWMRRYTKEGSAEAVGVILMCGRAGHMAVHTPDICYRGAGYEMVGEPTKYRMPGPGDFEFWTATFRQARAAGADLEIYWTWRAADSWLAPLSPRLTFGGQPYLYKLYLVREKTGDAPPGTVMAQFLTQWMPELEGALVSPRIVP
jgi:hypothetical protein